MSAAARESPARATRAAHARAVTRRHSRPLSAAALAGLLALGAGVLLYATRGTTFWADEWTWILTRRQGGAATLLDPHNSHFSLIPVLIYKALFATAGMRHYWPYRVVCAGLATLDAGLVYFYSRARVGVYGGLLAAATVIFFGPGWQDILWPFQIAWLITVATGIGALLALDRRTRAADALACALLVVSVCSAGPGLAMLAGALVDVALRRPRRDLWIPAVAIVVYGAWSLGYQSAPIDAQSVLHMPAFVFRAAAGVASSVTGLATVNVYTDTGTYLHWGAPLLVAALIAAGLRLRRLGRVPPRVVSLAVVLVGFWVLTGIGRAYAQLGSVVVTSTGDESRYLYIGAVFAVLLAAELLRGVRPPVWAAALIGLLVLAAAVSNLQTMSDGSTFLRSTAQLTEAELATLNLDRGIVAPTYASNGFIFGILTAGPFFAAERDLGSQAAVPGPVSSYDPSARQAADQQLMKIQGLRLAPAGGGPGTSATGAGAPTVIAAGGGTASARGSCVRFTPAAFAPAGGATALTVTVPATGLTVQAAARPAAVALRRFGPAFNVLGTVAAGQRAVLHPRSDGSTTPWQAQVSGPAPVVLCTA